MNLSEGNFFKLPETLPKEFELFESIISNETVTVEKIISTGQKTPDDKWLEQDKNEWVLLLQGEAELMFEDKTKFFLKRGDYVLIPKNKKHRVERTSANPCCIWLAVHY